MVTGVHCAKAGLGMGQRMTGTQEHQARIRTQSFLESIFLKILINQFYFLTVRVFF